MHPGVSAPHGQQVSQAPMMGMQPGMVPGGTTVIDFADRAADVLGRLQLGGPPPSTASSPAKPDETPPEEPSPEEQLAEERLAETETKPPPG